MEDSMLSQLLSGHFTLESIIAEILAVLLIIFLILPFHEWAHAEAAYLLGDKGIKERGRLSLNPLSHIDPVGALFMLLIGFGWAKPVPVDSRYFKNPKLGMGIVALMGPVANIVAEIIAGIAPMVPEKLLPGGHFITSGIIDHKKEIALSACEAAGLKLIEEKQKGDWHAYFFEKQ